ncbi:MAG: hypothetical protein INR66_26190 [Gordonia polyisoprenivorans]|nr:hypothetical protein [Gordonia polyisoprenivorans]
MTRIDLLLDHAQRLGLTADERETVAALLVSANRPQADHADLGLADDADTVGGDLG